MLEITLITLHFVDEEQIMGTMPFVQVQRYHYSNSCPQRQPQLYISVTAYNAAGEIWKTNHIFVIQAY